MGISYEYPNFFLELSPQRLDQLIHLNVVAGTEMSRIVMPGMAERGRGAVVNVSSASGNMPTALLSVYSATKAYMDFFAQGLNQEYSSKGVFVQVSCAFASWT